MKIFNTLLFFLCALGTTRAQYVPDYKKAADIYFSKTEYYAASEYYKKALNISPDSSGFIVPYGFADNLNDKNTRQNNRRYIVFKLAESLRLHYNYADAEKWYAIAKDFTEKEYVSALYWYANTLQKNGKYTEALLAYQAFIAKAPEHELAALAIQNTESCKFALQEILQPKLVTLSVLPAPINEKGSNYAAVQRGNELFFTSSRPIAINEKKHVLENKGKHKVQQKSSPFVNSIYRSSMNSSSETTLERINFNNEKLVTASPAISASGRTIYLTGWIKTADKKEYSIYSSTKTADGWAEPKALGMQVNVKGFNAMQPSISSDGSVLLFSSDRPGGLGKYDLWFCPIRDDGSFGQATNLGSSINTERDEYAGVYNNKLKQLVFSSNGGTGMGGFDLYESKGNLWELTKAENLGYPINSPKDDLYYSPSNASWTEGFVSSDRESLCCMELFKFKKEFIQIKGNILDCDSGNPVNGVLVTLKDSLNTETQITGADGSYHFTLSSKKTISIKAEKENYFNKVIRFAEGQVSASDTLLNPNICLQAFEVDKPIVIKDIFYDFNSSALTDTSKIVLNEVVELMQDNVAIEIEFASHTDSKGTDAYNLNLSQLRAQACVEYLVSKGIAPGRLSSKGYGESKPIAPNTFKNGEDNPEGRQLNRRTEFKVTKK